MRHRSVVKVEYAGKCAGRRIDRHVVHLEVTKRDHWVVGQRREPVPQPGNRCPEIRTQSTTVDLAVDLIEHREIRRVPKSQGARLLDGYSMKRRNLGAQITSQRAASFGEWVILL